MKIVKTQKGSMEWQRRVEYLDSILEQMGIWEEAGKEKHLAHIVFSTRLLYKIREIIEPFGFDISWGQLYDIRKKEFGPECDLIIFKGKPVAEWNKKKKKRSIIRVVLVNTDDVLAIIECRSSLKTIPKSPNRIYDQDDLGNKIRRLKKFGLNEDKIWLIAENMMCEDEIEIEKIKEIVIKHLGYKKLFYLNYAKTEKPNEEDWNLFLDEIAHIR